MMFEEKDMERAALYIQCTVADMLSCKMCIRDRNWDLSVFLRSWLDYDVFSQVNMY